MNTVHHVGERRDIAYFGELDPTRPKISILRNRHASVPVTPKLKGENNYFALLPKFECLIIDDFASKQFNLTLTSAHFTPLAFQHHYGRAP